MTERSKLYFAASSAVLLAAFLWASRTVLSPPLAGLVLLLVLWNFPGSVVAKRLSIGVGIILLAWLFVELSGILFPFVVSLVLAFLLNPLAEKLERWKVPRLVSTVFLFTVSLGLLILVGIVLIPSVVREISDLIRAVPVLADRLMVFVQKNLPHVLSALRLDPERLQKDFLDKFPSQIETILSNLVKGVSGIGSLLGQFFNVILIPVLTFNFLKDFPKVRSWNPDFGSRRTQALIAFYRWRVNRILGGYIRGQILVGTIVGTLTGIGLFIAGIPFAVLLGVMAGLLNVVPYAGLAMSLALALLAGLFTSQPGLAALKIGGVFAVVQGLESAVISPKILGDRLGLHPAAVIFSILVFSKLLGFWGLLLAVPIAALIKFVVGEWRRHTKWKEVLEQKNRASSETRKSSKPRMGKRAPPR
jgi:predicted PurR-regulated permease PerM